MVDWKIAIKMKMRAKQIKLAGIILVGLVVVFFTSWQCDNVNLMLTLAGLIGLVVLAYIFIIVNRQPL